ncbi:hypothetical protein LUZ60_013995 [Juncus effusus]|nr:hypothetical protein LUZ60_013995 [Juncus effusus]
MVQMKEISQTWWFDSHNNNSRQSPWLISTLSDLEEKTKQMLKLIEQDADSFAQRAEMYYKKRPLLVEKLGDLYRSQRSLAEQLDQLKSQNKSISIPSLSPQNSLNLNKKLTDNSSSCSVFSSTDSCESDSEVEDPIPDKESESEKVKDLKRELERVLDENKVLKEGLSAKDEEKREVIRQLSYSIDVLKEENLSLRVKNGGDLGKKEERSGFEFVKFTRGILNGKIFGRSLVAL